MLAANVQGRTGALHDGKKGNEAPQGCNISFKGDGDA